MKHVVSDVGNAPATDILASHREVMLRSTLYLVAACGVAGSLASAYSGNPQSPVHLTLGAGLAIAACFKSLPFALRAGVLVVTFYIAAFLELTQYGTGGSHLYFLMIAVFSASAFLGKRVAMVTTAFGVLLLILMGYLILHGVVVLTPERAILSDSINDWLTPTPVFLLGAGAMIAVTDYLLTGMAKSHADTLRYVDELQQSIKARDVARQELQASEERYRTLAENMRDVVYILDMQLNTTYISSSVFEQRGYTVEEAMALRQDEHLEPESLARVLDTLRAQMEMEGKADPDRATKLEYRIRCKDGSWIWVESVSTFLRDPSGAPVGILGVQRDISERKAAELERVAMQRQIQQMQKMESLGLLAGGIAHDFNNLLLGIMGNADLVRMELAPDNPMRSNLDDLLTGANHAASLCKQLLAYSGRGRFVIQPLDLAALVKEMAQLLEVSISKKTTIRYDMPGPVNAIEADVTQMRQVIMNLILNAADAIGDNLGTITISVKNQSCDSTYLTTIHAADELQPGNYVLLEVRDTGCGMDEETQQRIFDPFFSTKEKGHGLGLAAVVGIVVGHGGALKVYSELGRGTSFKVLLPSTSAIPAELPMHHAATHQVASGTVLVIDDDEPIRKFVCRALAKFGYTVLTAANGREGLALFESDPHGVSLVLLDMTMPVMSGEETFLALRKIRSDVKIVFSSGFNEQDSIHFANCPDISAFIQKPYLVADLNRTISEVLVSGD